MAKTKAAVTTDAETVETVEQPKAKNVPFVFNRGVRYLGKRFEAGTPVTINKADAEAFEKNGLGTITK